MYLGYKNGTQLKKTFAVFIPLSIVYIFEVAKNGKLALLLKNPIPSFPL